MTLLTLRCMIFCLNKKKREKVEKKKESSRLDHSRTHGTPHTLAKTDPFTRREEKRREEEKKEKEGRKKKKEKRKTLPNFSVIIFGNEKENQSDNQEGNTERGRDRETKKQRVERSKGQFYIV